MDIQEVLFGLKVTAIGMSIVFAALYGLQLLMYGMRAVFYKEPAPVKLAEAPTVGEIQPVEPEGLPTALVAAISVAVAAYMGGRPANIVSIRRDDASKTPWQQAARVSPMASRRGSQ